MSDDPGAVAGVAPAEADASWYALAPAEVAAELKVDPAGGLSTGEAQQRLQEYGPNALAAAKQEPVWKRFFKHYQDYMQIVLVVAALVSLLIAEYGTAIGLALLTLFNAWLGYHQEGKAEEAAASLGQMMKAMAKVRRDGDVVELPAEQIVPGDIVVVDAGDRVPADGRIILAATLQIEEGALTGESVAVEKDTETIGRHDVGIGDRLNMAFMNTNVTRGHGEILVTTTGMGSEVGHIAHMLSGQKVEKTPLTKQVDRLTIFIIVAALFAFIAIVVMGLASGRVLRGALRNRCGAGSRLHPGCAARRRHHHPVGRVGQHGQEERHHEGPPCGRDPGLHLGHQLGQDRHPDPEPDDGPRDHHRAAPLHRQRRGLQFRRPDPTDHRGRRTGPGLRDVLLRAVQRLRHQRRRGGRGPHRGGALRARAERRRGRQGIPPEQPARGVGTVRFRLQVHGHVPPDAGGRWQARDPGLREGGTRRPPEQVLVRPDAGRPRRAPHRRNAGQGACRERSHRQPGQAGARPGAARVRPGDVPAFGRPDGADAGSGDFGADRRG